MQLVRSCQTFLHGDLSFQDTLVGVTVGNFDGIHLGHQELLRTLDSELCRLSDEFDAGRPAPQKCKILITFEPHPRIRLSGLSRESLLERPEFWRVISLREKLRLTAEFGVKYFFALQFTKKLAATSPEEFIKKYLLETLRTKLVVVGHDWTFGKGRAGDVEILRKFGEKYNFRVKVVDPVTIDGSRVSSTAVKQALAAGNLGLLRALLGRNFSLSGKVVKGERRGRNLGFPTANMLFTMQLLPKDGVYATWVYIGETKAPAVTNVGVRPTFGGGKRVVETHIVDGSTYALRGSQLRVELVERLRDEKKFASAGELSDAVKRDIERANTILSS